MGNSVSGSAEAGSSVKAMEAGKLIVHRPAKITELTNLLETFENLNARVSETTGEDRSGDLGGAGAATGGQQSTQGVSPRDQAIQKVPGALVMRQRLTQHIEQEARKLERLAKAAARSTRPGAAHTLNELYAKIRRLHAMIAEILEASIEVLKRLFIRVFIDNQPIL